MPSPASSPQPRPPHELEEVLGLHPEDREDLPGLYELNAERVPRLRLLGVQVILAFALLHNLVRDVGVAWPMMAAVALVLEAYAFTQYWVLHESFARVRRIHLGTLFLLLDLVAFTVAVWATGAYASWLWPLYLVRVADQMWIGRRRAAAMALAAVANYGALLLWVAAVEGAAVPWGAELLKLAILGATGAYMVSASGLPWDLQKRTHGAEEMILRMERQSQELEKARVQAEEASRAKGVFLAQMSHELRTPLTTVMDAAAVLKDGTGDDGSDGGRGRVVRRIEENARHLLEVIDDLLDMTRLQEGEVEVTAAPVDLEALARDVVASRGSNAGPGVRVFVSFPRELLPLEADAVRVRQILVCLLDNALRYTHEGWVRVEVLADRDTGLPRELRVVDTGVGIAAPDHEAIFDPFRQLPDAGGKRRGGTGLGLAIARAMADLMGYSLSVRSTPGEGSTFSLLFREPAAGSEDAPDGAGGRPDRRDAPLDTDSSSVSPGTPRPG